jgi:hypothetical protein
VLNPACSLSRDGHMDMKMYWSIFQASVIVAILIKLSAPLCICVIRRTYELKFYYVIN